MVKGTKNKEKSIDSVVETLFKHLDKILATAAIVVTGTPLPLKLLGTGYLVKSYYDSKYKKDSQEKDYYKKLVTYYQQQNEYLRRYVEDPQRVCAQ